MNPMGDAPRGIKQKPLSVVRDNSGSAHFGVIMGWFRDDCGIDLRDGLHLWRPMFLSGPWSHKTIPQIILVWLLTMTADAAPLTGRVGVWRLRLVLNRTTSLEITGRSRKTLDNHRTTYCWEASVRTQFPWTHVAGNCVDWFLLKYVWIIFLFVCIPFW